MSRNFIPAALAIAMGVATGQIPFVPSGLSPQSRLTVFFFFFFFPIQAITLSNQH
jgi:hypothetical protein